MVTVEYAPGGSSAEHRHNAHTFVYVLEGTVVMQVKGGREVTLGPGQTFYESPEDVHTVSKNASDTKPAKFLVFFVKEKGAPPTAPANRAPSAYQHVGRFKLAEAARDLVLISSDFPSALRLHRSLMVKSPLGSTRWT
jgi:hypothetical protein